MATAIVLLVYGFSFFALGIAAAVRLGARRDDLEELTACLPWLAAFAFVHATLEWMLCANAAREAELVPEALQAVFVLGSFLLLFEFGRRLVLRTGGRHALLDGRITLALAAAALAAALLPGDAARNIAVAARLLVGTSAAALAGVGLLRFARSAPADYWLERASFRIGGMAFLLYAVLAGLVVPAAPWLPASWPDGETFKAIFGIRVEVLRTACALTITLAIGSTLFRDARLREKILLLTTAIVVFIMAIDLANGLRSIQHSIHDELTRDARDVRAMLMSMRRVYHKQFLASGLAVDANTVGFLPAHSLSRISRDFPNWSKSGLSFNNVSDKPRNPRNKADRFELAAMEFFRANPTAEERLTEIRDVDGQRYFHYTAPIWIESYCLECHGKRDKAPPSIAHGYDTAWDYDLGELRGVMSIKLPTRTLEDREYGAWFRQVATRLAGYTLLAALLVFFLNRVVTRRLAEVGAATARVARGDYAARSAVAGNDEIGELSDSFNRMGAEIETRNRELQESKENLERIVASRTAEVRDRALRLEAANADLESFSYSVSHDLRAPLRALDGYARILHEEEAQLGPESREMLARIMVNTERMSVLIDDILQFSRVGRTDMDWAETDMAALAREVVAELRADYPATAIRVGDLPATYGDAHMLRQVWVNLIANALKFSSRTERPEIEVDYEVVNGETVFVVRDNGAGFEMAYVHKLFGVFQRLHTEKQFPGTGAGLAIVKRIVERHGGRIWAESEVGKGATFRFSLAD